MYDARVWSLFWCGSLCASAVASLGDGDEELHELCERGLGLLQSPAPRATATQKRTLEAPRAQPAEKLEKLAPTRLTGRAGAVDSSPSLPRSATSPPDASSSVAAEQAASESSEVPTDGALEGPLSAAAGEHDNVDETATKSQQTE